MTCNTCGIKTIWENETAWGGNLSVKSCTQLEAEKSASSPFTHLISSLPISSERAKALQPNRFPYGDRRSDVLAFKMDIVYAAGKKFGGERLGSETGRL